MPENDQIKTPKPAAPKAPKVGDLLAAVERYIAWAETVPGPAQWVPELGAFVRQNAEGGVEEWAGSVGWIPYYGPQMQERTARIGRVGE
jgi:hypothetical protein